MALFKIPIGFSLVLPPGVTDEGAKALSGAGAAMLNTDAARGLVRVAEGSVRVARLAVWGAIILGGAWLARAVYADVRDAPVKHNHARHAAPPSDGK